MNLDGLGLSSDEQRAYLAVLGSPSLTLRQLSSALTGSSATAGRLVDQLVRKGLVTIAAGSPTRYKAVDPSLAVESLARRQIDRARRAAATIPALMETYWAAQNEAPEQDVIEVVSGPVDTVLQRADQFHQAAQTSVRTFDAPPYYDGTPADWVNPIAIDGLMKGVSYRTVYDEAAVSDPERWADLEAGMAAGEECRVAPVVPAKMMLIDDWAARITLGAPTPGQLTMVFVHRCSLLDALSALFEEVWNRAIPLRPGDTRPGDTRQADPRQERLIGLLAAGLSDSAIRRQLGVSASTVQRLITALMNSLGAKTRFQAGLQIGRLRAGPGDSTTRNSN